MECQRGGRGDKISMDCEVGRLIRCGILESLVALEDGGKGA